MDIVTIETFAKELIAEHCPSYNFVWSQAKTIHGSCNYSRKLIKLSYPYAKIATQDQIFNTITHEIAHAIVGRGNGHNHVWKHKHRELGGNGQRCSTAVVTEGYKYELTCEGGCWTVNYRRRPKTAWRSCRKCKGSLIAKAI